MSGVVVSAGQAGAVQQAAELLRAGGLVAFPTETVYGLGVRADDAEAVARVFAAKGRPADNPLIVHLGDLADVHRVAVVTPLAAALAAAFWPGPLTLVLDAVGAPVATATTAGLATVAVRVPDHPVALALLRAAAIPVSAPSANRSGRPSPTRAEHVMADLGDVIDLVLDGGPCLLGVESTVVDARGDVPAVLRDGAVAREALGVTRDADAAGLASSPGNRHRHYAPRCAVRIAPAGHGATIAAAAAQGARVGLVGPDPAPPGVTGLALVVDAAATAAVLYDALRRAETLDLQLVVVEAVPDQGIGRAVMDRLRRAAK